MVPGACHIYGMFESSALEFLPETLPDSGFAETAKGKETGVSLTFPCTEGEMGVQGPLGSWWSVETKPLLGVRGQSHRFLRRFDIHPMDPARLALS